MNKMKFAKRRKAAIAALCAVAVTCTGLAAACSNTNPDDETKTPSTVRKEDTQVLKNGNFEFFDVPEDAVYLIRNVNNWSRSGDSSGTMSGIINTSVAAWELMTDYELKDKLDANNDLSSSDPNYDDLYVNYNGMDSGDILYVDSYVASLTDKIGDDEDGYAKDEIILGGGKQAQRSYKEFLGITGDKDNGFKFRDKDVYFDEDSGDYYFDRDFTQSVRYAIINNPETHLGSYSQSGDKHYLGDTEILVDEDGNYYIDRDENGEIDTQKDQSVGNVLMVHNYPTNSKYNGIEQHYTSQTITLEANTSAEISVWVKTSDLKFDKGYLQIEDQDRGAYIEVTQTVASTAVDSFKIKAINTEKIIADNPELDENNGWLKYTIYVNGCDFASSTISIALGLGDKDTKEKVTGYAFFDDVEVKKYIDLSDEDTGCTYNENKSELHLGDEELASYCSLTSEGDEKVFYADKLMDGSSENPERFSTRFHYYIDLASENSTQTEASQKQAIGFSDGNIKVSAALTTDEKSGKIYASAETNQANATSNVTLIEKPDDRNAYDLPDSMKTEGGRPTFNDLIGIYDTSKTAFSADDFKNTGENGLAVRDLSGRLNSALTGANGLEAISRFSLDNSGSMLVVLSAYGAAYTTTIEATAGNLFTVESNKSNDATSYKIISFWVKTSDMNGATAATVRLVDVSDKDNFTSITIDTTNKKTDVGDEKNIYNDWVQCFFFVKNETDSAQTYKLELSFGNTSISGTSGTSYTPGWIAMANLQSLDVSEDIIGIVSEGTYSKILTFSDGSSTGGTVFDDATRMSNVKTGVGTPSNYYGVNGGSSYVSDKKFGDDYDKQNNNKNGITGLINREYFENYANAEEIARAFGYNASLTDATAAWNQIFGEDCYQPLIIVDSIRAYYDRATTTQEYFEEHKEEFYVRQKDADGNFVTDGNGNYVYKQANATTEWDETETYYSARQLARNYGYIGNSQSVSSGTATTISIRVKVSGKTSAWIYLVDTSSYDVMTFDLPEYSFYYDNEGNVLSKEFDEEWTDAEHREAIVYTLRDDGLYDGEDGVYANLYNLTTRFKYAKFENNNFYKDGKLVSYDRLEDGVIYYSDEACTKIAAHYLVVDEQRIYEYDSDEEAYYYLAGGSRTEKVNNFDAQYARYDLTGRVAPEYAVEVTDTNGEWVTVNFIIQTGNEAKNYRLELWSGERGETGITDGMDENSQVSGAVAFDYSSYSITSGNYSSVLAEYESNITDVYRQLIIEHDGVEKLTSSSMNIAELESILTELEVSADERATALESAGIDKDFVAEYYTFSWYDSAQFVPFNYETADAGQTGYDYSATAYSETLVYFRTRDLSDNSYNVFVDYSVVDQTVSLNNSSNADGNDHDHDDDAEGQSPWLLITSIILVVVLLFALVAILVRYIWKGVSKKRGNKNIQKNNYKKRERYIRKLGLVRTAPAEEEAATPEEAPSTEEAPIEETPAEEPAEAPVEESAETPVEETPSDETPADDGNKDE